MIVLMNTAKPVTVATRGCDLQALSAETLATWQRMYHYTALQVWTWRGGEALIACDFAANYGRGEYVAIVRTGGTKRGTVRTLYVACFKDAMEAMGIAWRFKALRAPRLPRTRAQEHRAALTRAAHRTGNMFRTLRARPSLSSSMAVAS